MKVSSSQPFQIIYSLFQHEYLGYLFESFVVRVDDTGKLTFQHQNISSKNSFEFQSGLDEKDFQLIELMDKIQQDVVVRKFSKKNLNPTEFFLKVYDKEKGNKLVQEEIENYIERKRSQILELLKGKMVFEMGNDGEPAGKQLQVLSQKASVLFHFRRNEDNTHYFPTIKLDGEKLEFQYKGAYIICLHPAWIVVEGKLFTF
ncbi:MAG: ATP-dependent helicase, partial [Cyclobacteriaceae bacterium]|nr:ATP-dependent helicase [Cyclobacteriaceae bacterium]